MKTLIIFLASAIMAMTTMMPVPSTAGMIMPPDWPRNEKKAPLNDYYIGIHRPDGSCETVEVFALTYDDAIKTVKRDRCDFCVLDDKTAYFTSGSEDSISLASRTCPLR